MYCRNCGDRLPTGATICPGCGAPTGQGKKKSLFGHWWFWVIMVVLAVTCILVLNIAVVGTYIGSEAPKPAEEAKVIVSNLEDEEFEDFADEDENFWDDQITETKRTVSSNVTVDEAVVYDENGVTITIKGIEDNGYCLEIKALVENNSGQDIVLSCDTCIVNGITIRSGMYITVKDGKKINDTFGIYKDAMDLAGITDIATISTYGAQILDPETYNRLGEFAFEVKTSIADSYKQKINDSGEILYDEDGITVAYQKIVNNSMGKSIILFARNDSGRDILIQSGDVSVNDYMLSGSMSDNVCDGTVAYCELMLFDGDLQDNGIEEIEDMAFALRFVDPYTYDTLGQSKELQIPIGG